MSDSPAAAPTRAKPVPHTAPPICPLVFPDSKLATHCAQQSFGTPVIPHNMHQITRDFTVAEHTSIQPADVPAPISHPESPLSPIISPFRSPLLLPGTPPGLITVSNSDNSNSDYVSPAFIVPKADLNILPHWVNDY
jgi:hypothetical protein